MGTRDRVVRIEVQGGVVVHVDGLPKGYVYEVLDHDIGEETCDLCSEEGWPHSCHSKD